MKTLWIVNHYATTGEGSTAGARHALLGARLSQHGWRTVILAASSEHYSGHQRVSGRRLHATQVRGHVTLRWIRAPGYAGNGIGRVLNMATFTLLALLPGSVRGLPRPDAVIGSSVHPLAAWAGARLARRFRVPFHFEIRDLWPETLIQMGAISRGGLAARGLRALESYLCGQATKVITTMPFAYEYLEDRGIPREKVVWISNGVEVERFAAGDPPDAQGPDFLYFGAFGTANALHVLVNGFAQARLLGLPETARLRLVGQGPERNNLRCLIDGLGLTPSVTVEGPVSRGDIPELASSADVLVVALLPLELYNYGISLNKLFEYMASGRPILFAGRARGNPLDERGGVVTDCQAGDVAHAMVHLARLTRSEREALGAHNRLAAHQEFSFESLAARLSTSLDSRIGRS